MTFVNFREVSSKNYLNIVFCLKPKIDMNNDPGQNKECPEMESFKLKEDNIFEDLKTQMGDVEVDITTNAEGLFICNQCDYTSKNKRKVKHHILSIHKGVKFQCNIFSHSATIYSD